MGLTPASSPADFLVTVAFTQPGRDVAGSFSSMDGGNPTADARRYRAGGSAVEEVSGGPSTRDDISIGREWRRDRDLEIYKWADRRVGRARATVTYQPLDEDLNPFGDAIVYSDALLIGATKPAHDSGAGTDVARLTMTFAVAGEIS